MTVDQVPLPGQQMLATEVVEQPESNTVRTGVVVTGTPLLVNVQGSQVSGSGYVGARPSAGDTVALIRQGESWLVLGKITAAATNNDLVGWAVFTGTTGFIGAETVILTIPSVTFAAGRAYEIDYEADIAATAVSSSAEFKIRRTSIAGALVRAAAAHPMASVGGFGTTCKGSAIVANYTSSDITDAIVLTLTALIAGTVQVHAGTNRLCRLRARDIGASVNYPSATGL